tara:strand:- start:2177 stop:2455 length:279 start_codon:yes stop_codon:yes gene_type:complete
LRVLRGGKETTNKEEGKMNINKFYALPQAMGFMGALDDNTVFTMDLMGPLDVALTVPRRVAMEFLQGMDPRDFHGVQFVQHSHGVHIDFVMD